MGLILENSLENIVFLSSNELFGIKHSKSRFYSKFKEGTVLNSYLELNSGDYVVHETKGIGKFLEITTMLQDGKHKDYLKIEYANNELKESNEIINFNLDDFIF